jgi:small nuclear ribonucleoprotein (snRNP)-like protein
MRRIPAIHYLLITLLAMPTIVWSRTEDEPNHGWSLLMAVQAGERLHVKLQDGRKVDGKLNSVSETMLVLSADSQTTGFNRHDILEIRLGRGRSVKKSILVGALIGTGAGAGLGGAAAASDNGEWFGTLIGLAIGFMPRQGDLIYKVEHE